MASDIILFPEFEKVKSEVEKLRTELSMLFLEQDELWLVECRNIEMAYMLELGGLEYKVYEAQCTYLRLKRKSEMIQARINRQEPFDLKAIDDALDIEFAEFRKKLNEQIKKMNGAIDRSQAETLSDKEATELKKLYRRIVKALHPDLHPDISEEKVILFDRAVRAYKNGDLSTMRIIDGMVSDEAVDDVREDSLQVLVKERDRLKALIVKAKEKISVIKSKYPYTMKELISDKAKIAERKAEMEEMLKQYQSAVITYKSRIKEMVG